MNKIARNFLVISIIFCVLVSPFVLIVRGEQSKIVSRISDVSEITIIQDSELNKPNTTLFRMNLTVEILNKDIENQTVTELSDDYPKSAIKVTFENTSLELELILYVHLTIMRYTYVTGITTEYDSLYFYINQFNLTQLPDGNYTVWRPINTAYPLINSTTAEMLFTIIHVSSGELNISYSEFDYYPTEVTSMSVITVIVVSAMLSLMGMIKRRKTQKTKKD